MTPTQTPPAATPPRKTAKAPSLWLILPLLLVVGLVSAYIGRSRNKVTHGAPPVDAGSTELLSLPQSQTMLVSLSHLSGYSLAQGRLVPSSYSTVSSDRNGQIAQVLVKVGQHVHAGDALLELSVGSAPARLTPQEKQQSKAEAAQVAAAGVQDALQIKLENAQERMEGAQQKVEAAKKNVDLAQDLVRRLRAGEVVPRPTVKNGIILTPSQLETVVERQDPEAADKAEAALREATKAESDYQQANDMANASEAAAAGADKELADAKTGVDNAKASVVKTEKLFGEGLVAGSEVEEARAALVDAQRAVTDAQDKATQARQTAATARANADSLHAAAAKASDRAAALANPQAEKQVQRTVAADSGDNLTPSEAAELVNMAVDESNKAVEEAQQIKTEIDGYTRQVQDTSKRLGTTGKQLQAAQENVLEHTIHASLHTITATAGGVVISVKPVASEVGDGDGVAVIGNTDTLAAQLVETGGALQWLKPGQLLPAVVQRDATVAAASNDATKPMAGAAAPPKPAEAPKSVAANPAGQGPITGPAVAPSAAQPATGTQTSVLLRVEHIVPPAKPGMPGSAWVTVPNVASDSGTQSMGVGDLLFCSLAKPGNRAVLGIPKSAVMTNAAGSQLVAVFVARPLDNVSLESGPLYTVEWRQVKLAAGGDVLQQEVAAGLKPGDRISLQPRQIADYLKASGPDLSIKLEGADNPSPASMPQAPTGPQAVPRTTVAPQGPAASSAVSSNSNPAPPLTHTG